MKSLWFAPVFRIDDLQNVSEQCCIWTQLATKNQLLVGGQECIRGELFVDLILRIRDRPVLLHLELEAILFSAPRVHVPNYDRCAYGWVDFWALLVSGTCPAAHGDKQELLWVFQVLLNSIVQL